MLVRSPATRSVRGPGQLGSRSLRAGTWPDVVVVVGLLVPATFVPLAAAGGGGDIVVPYQHFYIVPPCRSWPRPSPPPWRRRSSRPLRCFSCPSASCRCARSCGARPLTPELVPNLFKEYSGSAVAISAYWAFDPCGVLRFHLPAGVGRPNDLPFWPAGWLVLVVVLGLMAYAGGDLQHLAHRATTLSDLPIARDSRRGHSCSSSPPCGGPVTIAGRALPARSC